MKKWLLAMLLAGIYAGFSWMFVTAAFAGLTLLGLPANFTGSAISSTLPLAAVILSRAAAEKKCALTVTACLSTPSRLWVKST